MIKHALNIATLVDLISLVSADVLMLNLASPCLGIWPGRQGGYVSGFRTLAADLFKQHDLFNQLLKFPVTC